MRAKFFWGKTGSGKTLGVVKEAIRDFVTGRELWANMRFQNVPYYEIDMVDLIDAVISESSDMINEKPKTLILDEISTLFDGRRAGSNMNTTLSMFFAQCRKRRFNVYYTSQWISGADVRLRVLTDELIRCEPRINFSDVGLGDLSIPEPLFFRYYVWDIQNQKLRIKSMPRAQARAFYKYYDTFAPIRPVEEYIAV